MTTSANQKVSDFMMDIQSVDVNKYEMVVQIRALFVKCDPSLTEDIKYGGLVFLRAGELLCGIFVYKAHLSIELGNGATLSDPDGVLEGKGKERRHIKIKKNADILAKNVSDFVQASLAG